MAPTDKVVTRLHTANIPPFGLRLQQQLKDTLERAASQAGRSLNSEIVHRLQRSVEASHAEMDPAAVAAVEALVEAQGIPFAQALSMLVLLGASENASLIYVKLGSPAKALDLHDALAQAVEMQPDANVHIQSEMMGSTNKPSGENSPQSTFRGYQIGAHITNYTGSGVIVIRQGGNTSNID